MNINSQYRYEPPQPDNPADADRYALGRYALGQKGWPEDFDGILAAMAPPRDICGIAAPGSFQGVKVGVLGAGLAGLSAAYELRKMGFNITLYDMEERVGGRVYTRFFGKALYGEFGAMRIPVLHETVWHYLDEFCLSTRPFIQNNPNAFVYLKGIRVRNDPDGSGVAASIAPRFELMAAERAMSGQQLFARGIESPLLTASPQERLETITTKPRYSDAARLWSASSSLETMEAAGLSQGAARLAADFQPLLYANLYNSYIDYVQETYPANLTFLYEIRGGMCRLPLALFRSFSLPAPYRGIPARLTGEVRFCGGCRVEGLRLMPGAQKCRVCFRRLGTGRPESADFDFLVCAIPFSTLRMVAVDPPFGSIKMRAIREVNYLSAQKTLLLCRPRFWERQGIFGGGSVTDLPIASIWYPSDHAQEAAPGCGGRARREAPGVLVGSYNFGLDTTRLTGQPEAGLLASLEREIARVHGLTKEAVERGVLEMSSMNWDRQPSSRGALCFFAPQQKELFSYAMTQPEYGGRVFFAGEHISAVHRWMQGALQTGMQAADDLTSAAAGQRRAPPLE